MWFYDKMTEEELKAFETKVKDTFTREHVWRINHICPLIQKTCIEGACAAFCAPLLQVEPDDPVPLTPRWYRKFMGMPEPAPPKKFRVWARSAACNKKVFDRSSQSTRR